MDVSELIKTRRSIRKFKEDEIPKEDIEKILEAGLWAPSAANLQSRKFIVLKGGEKRKLSGCTTCRFKIGREPVSIVVCTDTSTGIIEKFGERGKELYAIMDCAASIQNMMLAAHSLGIGTLWIGAFNEDDVKKALGLPGHLRPVSILAFGYPDEEPEKKQRKGIAEACEFRE